MDRTLSVSCEPTKAAVLTELADKTKQGMNPEPFLRRKAGVNFFNQIPTGLKKLLGDPDNVALNLTNYIPRFSPEVSDIYERFEFQGQIERS